MLRMSLFALLLLAGCADQPSLQELEDRALMTGDWSEVERRERAQARMQQRTQRSCEGQLMLVCKESGTDQDCSCVSPQIAQRRLN